MVRASRTRCTHDAQWGHPVVPVGCGYGMHGVGTSSAPVCVAVFVAAWSLRVPAVPSPRHLLTARLGSLCRQAWFW